MSTSSRSGAVFAVVVPLVLGACTRPGEAPSESPEIALTVDNPLVVEGGLNVPESALHDAKADVYLVSSINGSPFGDDGRGFISRVTPAGKIETLRWVDGATAGVTLNAPKGLALVGDVLYVADVNAVRKFDRLSGKPLGSIDIDGAAFLNDVVAGPDGTVYVSDTGLLPGFEPGGGDAIYAIAPDDSVRTLVKDKDLGQPNGLAFAGDTLHLVDWSKGRILKVAADGTVAEVSGGGGAQGDGLVRHPAGFWLYSSWEAKAVIAISADGKTARKPYTGLEAPADIGLDARRGRLLVPLFNDAKLVVLPLIEAWPDAAE